MGLKLLLAFAGTIFATCPALAQSALPLGDKLRDSIVTILSEDSGELRSVGSGIVIRGDGLILAANHVVTSARMISIRLRNGELFDRVERVAADERRNLAVLRIDATGLLAVQNTSVEEALVGSRVFVVPNPQPDSESGILTSVSLADEIPGAGRGYRVLRFTGLSLSGSTGSLLIDGRGRAVGVIAPRPEAQTQNYALPLTSLTSLVQSSGPQVSFSAQRQTPLPTPIPIPQTSVVVPERPVLPLEARGPGSVVVNPRRPVDALLISKTIYIASQTEFFKPEHLVNALRKRVEMEQWGLALVDDPSTADLVLTLDHVLFTSKFTFQLVHQRTGLIIATGNVIVWDGNLGAPKMAERVVEKIAAVRGQAVTK